MPAAKVFAKAWRATRQAWDWFAVDCDVPPPQATQASRALLCRCWPPPLSPDFGRVACNRLRATDTHRKTGEFLNSYTLAFWTARVIASTPKKAPNRICLIRNGNYGVPIKTLQFGLALCCSAGLSPPTSSLRKNSWRFSRRRSGESVTETISGPAGGPARELHAVPPVAKPPVRHRSKNPALRFSSGKTRSSSWPSWRSAQRRLIPWNDRLPRPGRRPFELRRWSSSRKARLSERIRKPASAVTKGADPIWNSYRNWPGSYGAADDAVSEAITSRLSWRRRRPRAIPAFDPGFPGQRRFRFASRNRTSTDLTE